MPWSFTFGRFGGTAVKIHITFVLFLAWIAFSAQARAGWGAALDSTIFIVLLFLCVVLYEFGHVLAARRYGIQSPVVTLLPIGGVASMQRLPSDPRQELVVALAGPAVNLVIGVALILLLGSLRPNELSEIDNPHLSLMGRLAAANLFLAFFNLIPAFPMDGGRVLHALIAIRPAERSPPRSRPSSGRPSPSASVSSACSAIPCCCSSRFSSTWRRRARLR